jgi:hypothetical protein
MATKPTPKPKLKKGTGRYPGPGYNETGPGVPKKKASTSYSPKPMSANEKRAAGFRGATTQYQINLKKKAAAAAKAKLKKELKPIKSESRSKAGSSTVSKVVKRAKIVAREARDIPTAAANVIKSRRIFPEGGVAKFSKKDLKQQIKEVGSAIKSGKKGTQAATENYQGKKGTYVGGGGLDYYISRPKKPRK